jgi:hypothetical protein
VFSGGQSQSRARQKQQGENKPDQSHCALKTNLRETLRPAEKASFSPEASRHCSIVKNFTSVFLKKFNGAKTR